jgi:hypothetical protein
VSGVKRSSAIVVSPCGDSSAAPARPKNGQSYSLVVTGGTSAAAGGTSARTICNSAATAGGFLVTAAFQAAALRFLVFAAFVSAAFNFRVLGAFLPADFNFRVRAAFFTAALRFVGMGIPPRDEQYMTSPL